MAKNQGPIVTWSQYLGARLTAMGLTMFNVDSNLRTAAMIGRAMYAWDKRHRDRAARSISLAFPEWSAEKVQRVCKGSFEHFVQLAFEVCHTPRVISRDSWAKRMTAADLGPALDLLNARKPLILLTGHVGNWEVLGYLLAVIGYEINAIARPIDNRLINDWLLGIRENKGMRIITKWDATGRMLEVLGRGGALGFIADQNAGDKGMFVPFFGRLASSYKSIGLLAIREEVPIVCGYAHRTGPGFHYELGVADVIRPEDWQDRHDPLYYVTARYARAIETMVRLRPQQYLWMHRRWKSRPRHERLGKPMPKALRQNLEDLPWMDQPQMDRLLSPPVPA
jgi:Kdo2-lipid IVA lauroyltransferase/acyltransferase